MIGVLLRKQLMEVFSWIFHDRKKGVLRNRAGIVRCVALYLILFAVVVACFFTMALSLSPLIPFGYGWLYFAIMGLVSIAFGVFGSVFNTYASLYKAKDNDLLLSMPIPVRSILIVRLFAVFITGLLYASLVLLPVLIVWFMTIEITAAIILCTAVTVVMILIFVLVLSAVLGWVVALVSGKVKRKNITTAILSVVFLFAYFFVFGNAFDYLESIVANPQGAGEIVMSALYPFYLMGLAACGNIVSTLIFSALVCALFALVFFALSRSFIKLATSDRGMAKQVYRERRAKERTPQRALLGKEARRFAGSAAYMLNCGLGIVCLPFVAILLIWQGNSVFEVLGSLLPSVSSDAVCLTAAFIICFLTTMIDITAPSVSLEGKNIWIVRSLPVKTADVLMAKLRLQVLLAALPTAFLIVVVEVLLLPSAAMAILTPLIVFAFLFLLAAFGLFMNLKFPNLTWTNEIVPLKQGISILITVFGGWGFVVAPIAVYFLLFSYVSPVIYAVIIAAAYFAIALALTRQIRTKGVRIFEEL